MSDSGKPVSDHPFDDGFVGSGRPLGAFLSPISDEDVRRLEEAWNDPTFYNLAMQEDVVTAGWVPKLTVDPSRTLIPSEDEVKNLPHWARIAFTARCARRVFPLMKYLWKDAPLQHLGALREAIHVTESIATAAARNDDVTYPVHAAARAANDDAHGAHESWDVEESEEEYGGGEGVHAAVVHGADAALAAIANAAAPSAYHTIVAASAAVDSLYLVATVGTVGNITAPARDFERLRWLAEKGKWTDDTPVPPSVFGPMWEGPPPEWWTDDILAGLPSEPSGTNENREPSADSSPTTH